MREPFLFLAIIFLFLCSCSTGLKSISKRNPGIFRKDITFKTVPEQKIAKESKDNKLYIKKKRKMIIKNIGQDSGGSLYDYQSPQNQYFMTYNLPQVGDYIPVKIAVNRQLIAELKAKDELANLENKDTKSEPKKKSENGGDDSAGAKEEKTDSLFQEFPELEPTKNEQKLLLSQINMKIVHKYPSGDYLLRYERSSQNDQQTADIEVAAQLKQSTYEEKGLNIDTEDLKNVSFTQIKNGSQYDRKSSDWQDYYTLMLNDFDEAKSKFASQLESKRKDLIRIRDKLQERLSSMSTERRKFAKEREGWINKRRKDEKDIAKLNEKVTEQTAKIKEQEAKITDLTRPEQKPSDSGDE